MNYDMKRMNAFFDWFIKLGGNIYDQYSENIMDKFPMPVVPTSSLKVRAKEIKAKYNHHFIYKDIVSKEPNINDLKFDKK